MEEIMIFIKSETYSVYDKEYELRLCRDKDGHHLLVLLDGKHLVKQYDLPYEDERNPDVLFGIAKSDLDRKA